MPATSEQIDQKGARVTLRVGESHFTTLIPTLTSESAFFASIFSGKWRDDRSADGSYFVDADPELFTHILRYLRLGHLPILYTNANGFDYGLYQALEKQAEYFGIEHLRQWIADKEYLNTVLVQYSAEQIIWTSDVLPTAGFFLGNVEKSFHPCWKRKKVYQCPRGIFVHRGDKERCGRACMNAMGEDGAEYEDEDVLTTVVVTKRTHSAGTSQSV